LHEDTYGIIKKHKSNGKLSIRFWGRKSSNLMFYYTLLVLKLLNFYTIKNQAVSKISSMVSQMQYLVMHGEGNADDAVQIYHDITNTISNLLAVN
jgi:hypothetical protein